MRILTSCSTASKSTTYRLAFGNLWGEIGRRNDYLTETLESDAASSGATGNDPSYVYALESADCGVRRVILGVGVAPMQWVV
jgi:hypothetical protein